MSEHDEQVKLINWAKTVPELDCLFAIPNGGQRHIAVAAKLKREGVRAGVPDIFVALARGGYHGLFLEMKFGKGRLSDKQIIWLERLHLNNYKTIVAHGFIEARFEILSYLNL